MKRYLCVYLDEYINTHVNLVEADSKDEALNRFESFLDNEGIQVLKNEIYITDVEDICYI